MPGVPPRRARSESSPKSPCSATCYFRGVRGWGGRKHSDRLDPGYVCGYLSLGATGRTEPMLDSSTRAFC